MNKRTIGLISLGCAKNLVDSENMAGILKEAGYAFCDDLSEADVIIVNTCAFIDSAKQESIDAILSAAEYKKGKCRALIAAGCLSERYKKEILEELPELSAVVGVNDFPRIAEIVEEALAGGTKAYFDGDATLTEHLPRLLSTPPYTAYLKIAEGCDNFCSYCAIPYIRGRYRSRAMEDIVAEAKKLAASGVTELIVIAQDTGCYGKDLYGSVKLPELLEKLCKIKKIRWVRVHYCYPEEITDDVIDVFKREKKIVHYMDMPVQHCNDAILKKMNRKTTGAAIRETIARLRREIPDITIRTSLIAGFPGESEDAFGELCAFIREMKFDRLGAFAYSAEEGTAAARMEGQVDEEEKERRAARLMEIQKDVAEEINRSRIGSVLTVLVEGFDKDVCLYYGRSYADSIDVDAKVYFGAEKELSPGDYVPVRILDSVDYDLTGEMLYE